MNGWRRNPSALKAAAATHTKKGFHFLSARSTSAAQYSHSEWGECPGLLPARTLRKCLLCPTHSMLEFFNAILACNEV